MDFRIPAEDGGFRQELLAFLLNELPRNWCGEGRYSDEWDWEFTLQMRKKLAKKGWLTMHWPEQFGGQKASPVRSAIFNEAMAYYRAPGRDIFGVRMLASTLMIFGTDEQKKTFLPPISRGDVQWCQGYSEPDSGSDLASLQTRAVEDGDDLVVNGSKIWTTMAHRADWMMLLARTDPNAAKHRGISFLLLDMSTPGVSVRPIHNMTGCHDFNQVFFDNVRVPKVNLVGEKDQGWYVAVTLLDFERSGIDYSANARRLLDDLAQYARDTSRNGALLSNDQRVRNMLVERYIETEVARLIAYKVAWMQGQGLVPNREASMSKVFGTETLQRVTVTGLQVLGLYGQLKYGDPRAPLFGRVPAEWMFAFSHKIAAGTSEVQRNIIASRGLGLPRG
jgi:alkylation response protein AidB-like acyl-CoA dehydrogenase